QDRPYDRFIREQIAGDAFPVYGAEGKIATGFLRLGVAGEGSNEEVRRDLLIDLVNTTGSVFLGLTLGCARCHDHKFDPITTKDYYALAGIFRSTKTLDVLAKPRMWHEYPIPGPEDLARKAEHEKRLANQKERIAAVVAKARSELEAAKPGMPLPKNVETAFPEATRSE